MNKRQYKKALNKAVQGWQLERKEHFRYHMKFRKYLIRAKRLIIGCYDLPVHQQIFDICFNIDGTKKEGNL